VSGTLTGISVLELAHLRAAWAQTLVPNTDEKLFDIEKVADGAFFARARPQAVTNCNAAIFVNTNDVLVVDAHSKPSAAAALIAQIKREVTPKPVRYLVDTHFHWDHTQGNAAYRAIGAQIYATNATTRVMAENAVPRLKASLDPTGHVFPSQPHIPELLDAARKRAATAGSEEEKAMAQDQVRQLEAFAREMRNFTPDLPTVTFDRTYVIRDKAHELHLEFHGHAHTAGDVVVFCPQKQVVATGDMILGSLPFIADGFPKAWPKSIDSVSQLQFQYVMPGHGGVQNGRKRMMDQRNYLEELTARVEVGKKAGQSIADLQRTITVGSLRSLQADEYGDFLLGAARANANPEAVLQERINTNIEHLYQRLDYV
jgi:glyoxylase-like metal-dependent hydrolase (beta-lactamase superfamily II)